MEIDTKFDFTLHGLRLQCEGQLKIMDRTQWHEAFNGPLNRPIG